MLYCNNNNPYIDNPYIVDISKYNKLDINEAILSLKRFLEMQGEDNGN